MKKKILFCILFISLVSIVLTNVNFPVSKVKRTTIKVKQQGKKKTPEERSLFNEARLLHEYYRQVNPLTGEIDLIEKLQEKRKAYEAEVKLQSSNLRSPSTSFINRGPDNLGGRTRSLVIDISDPTGNTMFAAGISGGVFRTTNGGASWTKVSPNDQVHSATTIVQDQRVGFQNIWYYGSGEALGNSASINGAFFLGQGIWKSIDSGVTWTQMPSTIFNPTTFDSRFDIVNKLAVHPVSGELFAAIAGRISRFDGSNWNVEINNPSPATSSITDITFTSTGRAYAAFSGQSDISVEGVWTSATGNGGWSRINSSTFTPSGRVTLSIAPSNEDLLYVLFMNNSASSSGPGEADLFRWNQSTSSWIDFSSKIPDEPGGDLVGNDPFSAQGGYDLVVSVKPDNENFVVIGGTNAYRINNINVDPTFIRIGGYRNNSSYALWNLGGGDTHHPDIHALVFDPFNTNTLFSGSDGGIHKTTNISNSTISWENLNNNYQTYQYYHVAMDPQIGSNIIIGGAQDNGTTGGGTDFGLPNLTNMTSIFSGDGVSVGISRDDACTPFFLGTQNGNIVRDCPSFANITPTGSSSQFVTYFYLDPDNNNTLYYAGQSVLFRTTNSTNVTAGTWTNLGDTSLLGDTDYFQTFSTTRGTYNPASSYLLLGGDEGHIYRLDNPQNATSLSSAIDITPSGATIAFPSVVTGLAIHPTNNDIILATYSNYGTQSIFLTTNATSVSPSWTLVERNLSSHSIRSAAITEVAGQTFYFVGTARGLYSTTDPTTTDWVREAANQIGFAVVSSLVYRPSDNKLLIGTHGNGIYEATITNSVLNTNELSDVSDQINLFPNPAVDNIEITLNNDNLKGTYSIFNMLGQKILQGELDNHPIPIQNLLAGKYLIKIETINSSGFKHFIKK